MKFNNIDKYSRIKPYKAQNMIVKKLQTETQTPQINEEVLPDEPQINEVAPQDEPLTNGEVPLEETILNEEVQLEPETGYINVGVYTALGALPVSDAVVTIYTIDEDGEENAIYHVVSDANGRVPKMELPVEYDPENPLVSPEFYYSTYNMRIQAIGYYTMNVLDVRIYPDIATNYRAILIPVMAGGTEEESEQTVVIPPIPAEISNE